MSLLAEALDHAADEPDQVRRFADRLSVESKRLGHITGEVIELSRLQAHVAQFREIMAAKADAKDGGPGRKLDFLAQELLREANTIGSKGADAAIARDVVEMKTRIDRIKEQVQNVE